MNMWEISTPISINIKNLTKAYGKDKGIFDLSVELNSGDINLIVGKNGSGKSTLLKCIMKLVRYHGDIERRKFRIGYAPENYIMPDFMTVEEFLYNIGRIKGVSSFEIRESTIDFYRFFNLEKYRHRLIKTLSNGMKQKVNLIQALINEPKIVLLDEPLTALDFESEKKLISYLNKLAKTHLVIISTHNPNKFKTRAKRIIELENGMIK